MGAYSDALRKLQEDYENRTGQKTTQSTGYTSESTSGYKSVLDKLQKDYEERQKKKDGIVPVADRMTVGNLTDIAPTAEDIRWLDGYFKKGNDSAGKTILGTSADAATDIGAGFLGVGETITDAAAAILGKIAPTISNTEFYQNGMFNLESEALHKQNTQQASEATRNAVNAFVAKDLYDEQEASKGLLTGMISNQELTGKLQNGYVPTENDLNTVANLTETIRQYLDNDMENDSVLDEKLDGVAKSFGQRLATIGLGAFDVPWELVTGLTAAGSKAEESVRNGDNDLQTLWKMGTSAANEIIPEYFFGGSGLGEKGLFNLDVLTRGISNRVVKSISDYLVDMGAEGAEEVITDVLNNIADGLANGENIWNVLTSDEALHSYVDSFISGSAMSGLSNAMNLGNHLYTKTDYRSDFTTNEQKVYDRLLEDAIGEESGKGKVSGKRRAELAAEISEKMEKGYISTDLIEEVLGGEQYDRYRKAKNWEEFLQKDFDAKSKELETLRNSGDLTDSQRERLAELQKTVPQLGKQLENVKATSTLALMKAQMTNDVYQSTKSDARLRESFFERVRSTQAYRNDVTKYNEKQRQTIRKAIDSGILNNTGKTHDFVDLLARISADKGIAFDFTDNKRLKDSPFALEGKNVNGFVTKDGITLNINSHNTVNAVAGHEITHVLEGTEFYNELQKAVFDYARAKGELGSRWRGLKERYKGMDADINAELTSDLVGDYLFTDSDVLARLSTDNRNVFEKVFDEIKYLCRVATAGSQEARKLEKVKKAFEEAYRAETKNTVTEDGVKYSLMAFAQDGRRFVDVQMDANTFDGMTVAEMNRAAKAILMEKFAGKVIGIDNRAFVNGDSINEYLHPSKAIDIDTRKAKLTASGELDNLLDAGEALPNEPDGKDGHIHPDAIDFSYYKTVFKVGNEYFEGIVNIKNIKRGKLLKDITKIRNITKDIVSSYGENPKSNFLRDASMNSIRNSDGVVNTKKSQTDITDEIAKDMTNQIAPIDPNAAYSLSSQTPEQTDDDSYLKVLDQLNAEIAMEEELRKYNEAIRKAVSRNATNHNNPSPEQTDDDSYLKVLDQLNAEIAMEEEIRRYNEKIALEWLELEREITRMREEFEDADRAAELRPQREQTTGVPKNWGTIKKAVANSADSGTIKLKEIGNQFFAKIPEGKFTAYCLNPEKAPDKARVFKSALGYDMSNFNDLIDNIDRHIDESKFVEKGDKGHGMLYEYIVELTGPNGKTANVLTAWIDDNGEKRLTSAYVTKKKVTK